MEYDVGVGGVGLVGDCVTGLSPAGKSSCLGGRDVGEEVWAWAGGSGGEMSVSQVCWLPGLVVSVCAGVVMSVIAGGGVCSVGVSGSCAGVRSGLWSGEGPGLR